MIGFFEDVLKMPYLSGGYQDSPQEKEIKRLLRKYSFVEKPKGTVLKDNEYIYQPNGENNSPDFYVKSGKLHSIECKSTKKGAKPVYNGGLPHDEYIYIFSSGKYDETTIYYGKDILPKDVRKIYDELTTKLKDIVDEFNEKLNNCEENNRGFNYYCRNMYTQAGKAVKTNYFTHKDRNKCEQNVLNTFR